MDDSTHFSAGAPPSPRISVVVTTFRRDDILAETLRSLVQQNLPLHEIIVVDDGGATGQTESVVRQHGAKYLPQANAGQQAARNTGAAHSTGEWIAFLDDDDLWEPDRHALVSELAATGRVDLICGNFRKFSNDWLDDATAFDEQARLSPGFWGGIERAPTWSVVGSFPSMRMFPQSPFWPSTLVVHRDLFLRLGGWDVRLRGIRTEDFDFAFRAVRAGALGLIWKPTLRYRIHSGERGNHTQHGPRVSLGRVGVWRHLLRHTELSADERAIVQKAIRAALLEAHWSAFAARDYAVVGRVTEELGGWSQLPMNARAKALWSALASTIRRRSGR